MTIKMHRPFLIIAAFMLSFLSPLTASAQVGRGIENRQALQPFFLALGQLQTKDRSRPVRVVQYGDSHTVADILPGALEKLYRKDFGATGVVYDVYGQNGMRAKQLYRWVKGWTRRDYNNMAAQSPDLIVLAYGSNEVTDADWSVESYAAMFAEIISCFRRAAPNAALLVLAPPDRAVLTRYGWQTAPRMPELLDAQRRAAYASHAGFWSACDAMGGFGSMNLWAASGLAQPDHVHLTTAGYVRLGKMFHYDFVLAFNEFVEAMNPRG